MWAFYPKCAITPTDVAKSLGITTATLYAYVNSDGSVKEKGQRILDSGAIV